MKSLSLFVVLALAVAGSALMLPCPAVGADEHPHHEHLMKCAKVCLHCQEECDSCFLHCKTLVVAGKKDHARTMDTCLGCAEYCSLAAKLSGRNSPFAGIVCESCAKVCEECGEACEKFKDDEHMARCAHACRECAKECREMVKHLKH